MFLVEFLSCLHLPKLWLMIARLPAWARRCSGNTPPLGTARKSRVLRLILVGSELDLFSRDLLYGNRAIISHNFGRGRQLENSTKNHSTVFRVGGLSSNVTLL